MKKVAVVFPGQGSQYSGMASALRGEPLAEALFDEASESLGRDLWSVCGDTELLRRSELSQPAILTCSVAAYQLLTEQDPLDPTVVAGHSMGEITALTCTGALDFGDAIRLVHRRGQLMSASTNGRMAVVFGLDRARLEKVCAAVSNATSHVSVANENSREQFVISGEGRAVAAACAVINRSPAVASPLEVFVAAHSPYMESVALELAAFLETFTFRGPETAVLSCTRGHKIQTAQEARDALSDQLVCAVEWRQLMRTVVTEGVQLLVECGPKNVLRDLARLEHPEIESVSVSNRSEAAVFFSTRQREAPIVSERWREFFQKCLAAAVAEENRSESPQRSSPRIRKAFERMQFVSQQTPSEAHVREVAELLRQILKAKKTPASIVSARLTEITVRTDTEWLTHA